MGLKSIIRFATVTIKDSDLLPKNWWGDSSGPLHLNLNPSGKGDTVSDNVD